MKIRILHLCSGLFRVHMNFKDDKETKNFYIIHNEASSLINFVKIAKNKKTFGLGKTIDKIFLKVLSINGLL